MWVQVLLSMNNVFSLPIKMEVLIADVMRQGPRSRTERAFRRESRAR